MEKVEILHNTEEQVFHTFNNEKEAYLKYRKKGPVMLEYFETYVPPLQRGRKIASQLAKAALEYARSRNLQVIPTCSFVASYMDRHHEYDKMRVRNMDNLL